MQEVLRNCNRYIDSQILKKAFLQKTLQILMLIKMKLSRLLWNWLLMMVLFYTLDKIISSFTCILSCNTCQSKYPSAYRIPDPKECLKKYEWTNLLLTRLLKVNVRSYWTFCLVFACPFTLIKLYSLGLILIIWSIKELLLSF